MSQIYLFSATSQLAQWLSLRQSVIAENVANLNSPGYSARDVEPFSDVMQETRLRMAATAPGHLGFEVEASAAAKWDVSQDGAGVSVERELIKADEVGKSHALHSSVAKAFHRMLLMSVK